MLIVHIWRGYGHSFASCICIFLGLCLEIRLSKENIHRLSGHSAWYGAQDRLEAQQSESQKVLWIQLGFQAKEPILSAITDPSGSGRIRTIQKQNDPLSGSSWLPCEFSETIADFYDCIAIIKMLSFPKSCFCCCCPARNCCCQSFKFAECSVYSVVELGPRRDKWIGFKTRRGEIQEFTPPVKNRP